jgi:mannan endo-1,4-beta-mannosidase
MFPYKTFAFHTYLSCLLWGLVLGLLAIGFQNMEVYGKNDHDHNSYTHESGFVQQIGTHFILRGKPYYFNGFNAYWLMMIASDPSTKNKVTTTLQEASQHGLSVARTWAFNDGPGYKALQISPGSYDEDVFKV